MSDAADRRRYPGVQSFEEGDSGRFFGRTQASDELLMRVMSVKLLLQFAPSGAGKTSLLNAGLFPRLRPRGYLPFSVRLNEPTESLMAAVVRSLRDAASRAGLRDPVIPGDATSLWDLLQQVRLFSPQLVLLMPVIVFDQFEEVFSLRDQAFRDEFAREIGELTRGRKSVASHEEIAPDVKVIISLREEYLGALEEMSSAIPELFRERLRLLPLSGEEAREAMIEPARLAGDWYSPRFELDRESLDQLIDFIDGVSDRVHIIETLTLQLVCQRAEEIARTQGGDPPKLKFDDFGGISGLDHLVSDYYNDVLNGMPAAERKKVAELFEQGLLDSTGKRRMLEREDIGRRFGLGVDVLDKLTKSRLLRQEPRNESIFYEISHDRLTDVIAKHRSTPLPTWARTLLAVAASMILVLVGGLFFIVRAHHATEQSRQQTEKALEVLFGDELTYRLRDAGLSASLEQVFAEAPPGTATSAYSRAHRLRIRSELAWERSTLSSTEGFANEALSVIDEALGTPGADRRLQAERVQVLRILGDVYQNRAEVTRAEAAYRQALAAWNAIPDPDRTLILKLNATELRVDLGVVTEQMGDPVSAETLYVDATNEALGLLTQAYRRSTSAEGADGFLLGRAMQNYSDSGLALASVWFDRNEYRHARALAAEAVRLRPFSAWSRSKLGAASINLARALYIDEREHGALYLQESRQQFTALERSDPGNRRIQRDRAAVELVTAQIIGWCAETESCGKTLPPGEIETAESWALDAGGRLQDLAKQDPDSRSLQRDIGWAAEAHAQLRAVLGHPDESDALLDEAMRAYTSSSVDPRDTNVIINRIEVATAKSKNAAARGDAMQALQLINEAIAAAKKLPGGIVRGWRLHDSLTAKAERLKSSGRADEARSLEQQADHAYQLVIAAANSRDAAATGLRNEGAELNRQSSTIQGEARITTLNGAVGKYREALAKSPIDPQSLIGLAGTCSSVAHELQSLQGENRDTGKTEDAWRCAIEGHWLAWALKDDLEAGADRSVYLQNLHDSRENLALLLRLDEKRVPEALMLADQGVRDAEALFDANPSTDHLYLLADSYYGLGMMREESGHSGWEQPMRAAIQRGEQLSEREPKAYGHQDWLSSTHHYFATLLDKHSLRGGDAERRLAQRSCESATDLAKASDDKSVELSCRAADPAPREKTN